MYCAETDILAGILLHNFMPWNSDDVTISWPLGGIKHFLFLSTLDPGIPRYLLSRESLWKPWNVCVGGFPPLILENCHCQSTSSYSMAPKYFPWTKGIPILETERWQDPDHCFIVVSELWQTCTAWEIFLWTLLPCNDTLPFIQSHAWLHGSKTP